MKWQTKINFTHIDRGHKAVGVSGLVVDCDVPTLTIINDLIHLSYISIEKINWNTFHLEPPPTIYPLFPLTDWGN